VSIHGRRGSEHGVIMVHVQWRWKENLEIKGQVGKSKRSVELMERGEIRGAQKKKKGSLGSCFDTPLFLGEKRRDGKKMRSQTTRKWKMVFTGNGGELIQQRGPNEALVS